MKSPSSERTQIIWKTERLSVWVEHKDRNIPNIGRWNCVFKRNIRELNFRGPIPVSV